MLPEEGWNQIQILHRGSNGRVFWSMARLVDSGKEPQTQNSARFPSGPLTLQTLLLVVIPLPLRQLPTVPQKLLCAVWRVTLATLIPRPLPSSPETVSGDGGRLDFHSRPEMATEGKPHGLAVGEGGRPGEPSSCSPRWDCVRSCPRDMALRSNA